MSYICTYCNGMSELDRSCPKCGGRMSDGGRMDDYTGPYAPYRPIDAGKLTNGYSDWAGHTCIHQAYCSRCGYKDMVPLNEIRA